MIGHAAEGPAFDSAVSVEAYDPVVTEGCPAVEDPFDNSVMCQA